jgi:hypothetical protein
VGLREEVSGKYLLCSYSTIANLSLKLACLRTVFSALIRSRVP